MLSAPVCRQAGWLNAECRMQIEKRKIAFCQIGTLARLHVCTLERWHVGNGNWKLGNGNWEFLFSVSRFPFLLYARLQSCKLESLQVNTFQLQVYKLQVKKL